MIPPPKVHLVLCGGDELDVLSGMLERAGYAVASHRSADAMLAGIDPGHASCVVADTAATGVGGPEFIGRLLERSPRVTLVLVSERSTVDEAVAALREGAADYLLRPIDPASLVERVNELYDSGLEG